MLATALERAPREGMMGGGRECEERKIMRTLLSIGLLSLLSIAVCQQALAVEKDEAPIQGDPAKTAKLFLELLHAGKAAEAFQLCAVNDKMPKPFVEDEKGDLERISVPMKAGTWRIAFVEVHKKGAGAIVVIDTSVKRGKPSFDLDPLYLVLLNGKWWVVPGVTKHKPASLVLPPEDYAVFESLEEWFKKRKQELIAKRNEDKQ